MKRLTPKGVAKIVQIQEQRAVPGSWLALHSDGSLSTLLIITGVAIRTPIPYSEDK
jgi:hypothetical protein